MKRVFSFALAFVLVMVLIPLRATAMPIPPRGADYGMGPNAPVIYKGNFNEMLEDYDQRYLPGMILKDNNWELIDKAEEGTWAQPQHTIYFINGKIFNLSYPDGLKGYDWLLTEQQYVYENGRYAAFHKQMPQAFFDNYIVFDDFYAFLQYVNFSDGKPAHPAEYNPKAAWYTNGVITSTREGFFVGIRETDATAKLGYKCYFKPEDTMTRAEVVTTIMRASFPAVRETNPTYSDVPSDSWFAASVNSAYKAGLIDDAESFYPDEPATREFAAKMLSAVMKPGGDTADLSFSDAGQISPDYVGAVKRLYSSHIITGFPDNTFRPEDTVTRAEYAVMLGRIIDGGLMNIDTPNEAYAKAYQKLFFDTYPDFSKRYEIYHYNEGSIQDSIFDTLPYPLNENK